MTTNLLDSLIGDSSVVESETEIRDVGVIATEFIYVFDVPSLSRFWLTKPPAKVEQI